MITLRKAGIGLAVLAGMAVTTPVLADEATAAFQSNVDKAIATVNQMQTLFDQIDKRHRDQAASIAVPGSPVANASAKTYTVVLRGAMCPICAGAITKSLESVNGTKVVMAPKQGTGQYGGTIAVVELNDPANASALAKAVEGAQTPEREKVAPAVVVAIPGRLKDSATPQQVNRALRQASLIDTTTNRVKTTATSDDIHNALQKADLLQ